MGWGEKTNPRSRWYQKHHGVPANKPSPKNISGRVSVFIPTKNRPDDLKRMLKSLSAQTYKDFEIIIDEQEGLVESENAGLERATGEFFIRTDDDVITPPEWLEEVVKTFMAYPEAGGVSGPIVMKNWDMGVMEFNDRDLFAYQGRLTKGNWFWRLVGKVYYNFILEGQVSVIGRIMRSGAFTLGSNMSHALKLKEPIEIEVHDCCNMACRTELLRQVGGFDSVFRGVAELNEPDVSFKILKLGHKIIFNPKCFIYHTTSTEGVYDCRDEESYDRMRNFQTFFHRYFRVNPRFYAYVLFQNGYYFYRFLKTGKIKHLGAWLASIR